MASALEASLGSPIAITQQRVECSLSWRSTGASPDIHLEALLAGSEGDRLGVVHRDLHKHAMQVAAQWEGCGVKHTRAEGCASGDLEGCEEISVDFSLLNATGIVDFVFISARANNVQAFSELALASLEVKGTGCVEQLASNARLKASNHGFVYIFCRCPDGHGWAVFFAQHPLDSGAEEIPNELVQSLAEAARKKVAKSEAPQPEVLECDVSALAALGKFEEAIKQQELLIQNLVGADSSPASTSKAFDVLGELQRQAASAASGASSSTMPSAGAFSMPAQQDLTASNRLMQAQIEPLDNCGYEEVKALSDPAALSAYVGRILNANNWRCGEVEVSKLVANKLPDTYDQLVELLRASDCPAQTLPVNNIRDAYVEHQPPETLPNTANAGYAPEQLPASEVAAAAIPAAAPPGSSSYAPEPASASAGSSTPAATSTAVAPAAAPMEPVAIPTATTAPPSTTQETAIEPSVQGGPLAIFEPPGGDVSGGSRLKWVADGAIPTDLEIAGRPCAALEDGFFITPLSKVGTGPQVVMATFSDGRSVHFPNGFSYWVPGKLLELTPDRGKLAGGSRISVRTSDLGANISEVLIGGVSCVHAAASSSTSAEVVVPAAEAEGAVAVEVRASNGNSAVSAKDAFLYYPPECFGLTSQRIQLSNENRTATRTEGVTGGVCLGAVPLRRCSEGRYFEVLLTEWISSMKTMAVGVAVKQDSDLCVRGEHIWVEEAREFQRAWLAGYDVKGGQFINDEETSMIKESLWRPARHLKPNADKRPIRLGVLWSEPADELAAEPALVIFQDGVERVRLPAKGRLPSREEPLFAVVDLQGNVKCASLVEGASPPRPAAPEEGQR